jgi:hypothetical protein
MATDKVDLQRFKGIVVDNFIAHGAKRGINAIDDMLLRHRIL